MENIKCRVINYAAYGLNKKRSIFHDSYVNLKSNDELFNFMTSALDYCECDNCAIFAVDYYDGMWAGITTDEYGQMELIGREDFDMEFFEEIDGEYRLCCYGLMFEVAPGKWRLI